jgi:hypothetical protein
MPFYPFTPVSSGGGSVSNVAGGDASIAATNPAGPNVTLVAGTLDVLASLHPAAAAVGLNGQKIINLANGVAGSDGAAFGQLAALLVSPALTGTPTAPTAAPGDTSTQLATDAFVAAAVTAAVQGLAIKPSVQAATVAALPANTYSNGASGVGATLTAVLPGVLVVDGITVALGNRVLVQDEVAAANNGIYVVTTLGTVSVAYILTRAADMNQAAEVPGAFTFVEAGTVNAGAGFTVAGAGPYVIGTTAINWTQFSGAGEITAGAGLVKAGNTLSLGVLTTAGDLIIENATPAPARLAVGTPGQSLQVSGGLPAWAAGFVLLASTGAAGFALQNGTPTILTYTFPNDGLMHRFWIVGQLAVTVTEVGGTVRMSLTAADGTVATPSVLAASQGVGLTGVTYQAFTCKANTTVQMNQTTALTSGAGVLYAEIWGS